ncbi:MAG: hypothetical protein HC772_16800 [Leptolyngbyaceae cyanobacterium CRU_2_3]|nr:hypothetical protein [Leptolyngbyaceae cyanobacterium CRU_2_3]
MRCPSVLLALGSLQILITPMGLLCLINILLWAGTLQGREWALLKIASSRDSLSDLASGLTLLELQNILLLPFPTLLLLMFNPLVPAILKAMALTLLSLTAIASSPALAEEKFAQDAQDQVHDQLGLCGLHNLSGYSAINSTGTLVNLTQYCRQQQGVQPSASYPFWQMFLKVADLETIAYAQTLGQNGVTAYGATICPFLQAGGTLEQLRQIQVNGELLSNFEVAVAVAAIHTDCPIYQTELVDKF